MNQNDNQFENKFMNVVKCLLLTYLIQDLGIFNGRFLNGMYVYIFQDFVLIFMLLKQKICTKTFFFMDGAAFKSVFHFTTLYLKHALESRSSVKLCCMLRCKTSIPVNRVILAYFGTALRDFLKHQPWIKHQLSFFSSATVSMMSMLDTFISSIAHKVAFLFLKDLKNYLSFGIR